MEKIKTKATAIESTNLIQMILLILKDSTD